jgi:ferrochelatase
MKDGNKDERIGVLLLNLGGPWTLDDIKPFLRNLFSDRDIIPLPGGPALQGVWARFISAMRTPKVRKKYAEIGGGSPLLRWTRVQASGLLELLNGEAHRVDLDGLTGDDPSVPGAGGPYVAALGMRYTPPTTAAAIDHLKSAGCRRVVVLPLYPQECMATTGSSYLDLERALAGDASDLPRSDIRSFHRHPLYLEAMAEKIREGLDRIPADLRGETMVLFSAHGIPLRIVETGDPYVQHVRETVEGLVSRLGDDVPRHRLAYQSRTGPVKWTEPGTDDVLVELGRNGTKAVLLVPISFVSDHIETLHEVDIEFAEVAGAAGIEHFHRAPSLNDSPTFLRALRDIVVEAAEAGP